MSLGFIPARGGHEELLCYQRASVVHKATVGFCARFLDQHDHTAAQTVLAARSSVQSITESAEEFGASKEAAFKLCGVARAGLEQLLARYRDLARRRNVMLWDKDDPRTHGIRALARDSGASYRTYAVLIEHGTLEEAVNTVACLILQTIYLLERRMEQLSR